MNIEKNNTIYTVKENKKSWTISIEINRVSFSENVPKDICKTIDDLKRHIAQCNLF